MLSRQLWDSYQSLVLLIYDDLNNSVFSLSQFVQINIVVKTKTVIKVNLFISVLFKCLQFYTLYCLNIYLFSQTTVAIDTYSSLE